MTKVDTGAGSPADALCHARRTAQSRFKRRLLAGVATLALLGVGSAYTLSANSADTLLAAPPFGASSAARAPTSAIVMPGFSELVSAVKPAVVSVRVKADTTAHPVADSDDNNPLDGPPFERFFKFRSPNGRGMMPDRQPRQFAQGQGSGFFISADGYIVTNNHVVDHAVKVEVLTDSGATFDAKVVGTDAESDLALIKVDGHTDFPFVKLAAATPKIGEWVVAMGNPFGLGGTVTAGIVSAQGRDIGTGLYDDYIQIDAPINRGNSGGPTFNLKGEVIGVNTAIYSPSGGSVGIAFAIPSSTVASVVPQLQKKGQVSRGWLGVQIQPVTGEIAESLGLKTPTGALVSEPQADSPAAKAGLKSGDVVTSVNAIEVKDPRDLARKISTLGPDEAVSLGIIRDGKEQTISLKLGQLTDQKVRRASANDRGGHQLGSLGLTVVPATRIEGAGEKGLAVVGVDPNGKAAELGFKQGDIILKAGNRDMSSFADLTAAMSEAAAGGRKNTLVMIKRDQAQHYVAVPTAIS
jgi:serine protease Do